MYIIIITYNIIIMYIIIITGGPHPLPLMKSPGLAPTAFAVFTSRAAAGTLQKLAVSGMFAVYRGAGHRTILLQTVRTGENVSRLY